MTTTTVKTADASTPTNCKTITRRAQLEELLQRLAPSQLQTFVLETALRDTKLRDALLIEFGELLSQGEPAEAKYRQTLNTMIDRYVAADGYISQRSAQNLTKAMEALLQNTRKPSANSRETIDLCVATISVLPRLGEKMDDTDGHIYRLMRLCCVLLWELFKELPAAKQTHLFERILREYAEPIYLEMDLDGFMLALLREWAAPHPQWQKQCLHQHELLLKDVSNDKWRKNYLLEQTQALLNAWQKPA